MGEHRPQTWVGTVGYYSGMAASMGVGMFYGGTWLKFGLKCVQGAKIIKQTVYTGRAATNLANRAKKMHRAQGTAKKTAKLGKKLKNQAKSGNKSTKQGNVVQNPTLYDLSKAGQVADRERLTKAGRAFDKHGNRPGSAFPKATGNTASKNRQGQYQLDDILTDPKGITKLNKFEGLDYLNSNGKGARFNEYGEFNGFLEP